VPETSLITVAVPSYNYAEFLGACLNSLLQQDYERFEVLIADGGSTDGSLKIIESYCTQDKRFRLVSTTDHGQADAIRIAFEQANGDILCFLNADDCYLCADTLSSVAKAFNANPSIDILSFGGHYLDANGQWMRPIRLRYHPLDGFHLMRYRTAVVQPATFWRKKVYDELGWPVQFHYVFDVVFFYKAYQKYAWAELPKSVAGYRMHGDNKSAQVRSCRIKELACFEEIKFGAHSFRVLYLVEIAVIVQLLERMGVFGKICRKLLYQVVNTLAFVSVYRLPSI
jgi:glycosyltransferase involved in cell wall biosynthesis